MPQELLNGKFGGCKFSPYDPRVYRMPIAAQHMAGPPASPIDLRDVLEPTDMKDQDATSSCTGMTAAECREALEALYYVETGGQYPRTSLSGLYGYARNRQLSRPECFPEDEGADMQSIGVGLLKYGACPEELFPFPWDDDPTQRRALEQQAVQWEPSAEMDIAAGSYKIGQYMRILGQGRYGLLSGIWTALASRRVPAIAFQVYNSLMDIPATGKIPMPNPWREVVLGGHAVSIWGCANDRSYPGGGFCIMRNHWTPSWGAGGYARLPYQYFFSGLVVESWAYA